MNIVNIILPEALKKGEMTNYPVCKIMYFLSLLTLIIQKINHLFKAVHEKTNC